MALLEIKKAGDPVLKEVCAPVEKIDKQLKKLMDDMAETMYQNDGVGLAAPQIGKSIRLVVIDCQDDHGLIELINPVITFREGTALDTEGCLSVPNIFGEVERSAKVKVEFLNRRGKKQHLTDAKGGELLQHFQDLSLRDYAIVNLMLRTGLRTVEVVRADVGDITYKGERRVLLIWGKGHTEKDDFVVLTDKAYEPIRAYLSTRKGVKAGEPLFTSTSHQNRGERLTTRTISSICKDGLKAIGLDGKEYTAHSLRHTTAVAILKHGGAITDVQEVLRHTSPATSQIYTESVKEELRLEKAPESVLDYAF